LSSVYYLWLHASFGHQTLLCAFHHPRWYLCKYQAPVSIHTSNNNKLLFFITFWPLIEKMDSRVVRSWFGLLWVGMDNLCLDELSRWTWTICLVFPSLPNHKCCVRKITHFESIVSNETAFCSLHCSSLKLF